MPTRDFELDRFSIELVAARGNGLLALASKRICGHADDRDVSGLRIFLWRRRTGSGYSGVLGARLSAPIGYNLACSIEVASLAVMCPLGPASASNLVKSNVIEWKSADEICTLWPDGRSR